MINLLVAESNCRYYLVEEGVWDYINYGVTDRAIDSVFGGKKKLETLVKNELKSKYKSIDNIDSKEIEKEIKYKSDSVATQLMKKEFLIGLKGILLDGLINGLVNACVNSIITFITTLNVKKTIENLISGFIVGVIVKFVYKAIELVYNEFKKRILQDPYAEPNFAEKIALSLLTISTFSASVALYAGIGVQGTLTILLINLILNIVITIVFNFSRIKQLLIGN